jgi:hypothetical protein
MAVVHLLFLQRAFGAVAFSAGDWLISRSVASSVVWVHEAGKLVGDVGGAVHHTERDGTRARTQNARDAACPANACRANA